MNAYYCDHFRGLLRLSPLTYEFYGEIYTGVNDVKRTLLIKNVLSLFIESIQAYSYCLGDSVSYESYSFLDFQEIEDKLYCIDDNDSNFKIQITGSPDDFRDLFTKIIFHCGVGKLLENDSLYLEYVDTCLDFIFNCEDKIRKQPFLIKQYISCIYKDIDSELLESDQINFLLNLFNSFCQSLLRGEYLVLDDFSSAYLKDAERKKHADIISDWKKMCIQKTYELLSSAELNNNLTDEDKFRSCMHDFFEENINLFKGNAFPENNFVDLFTPIFVNQNGYKSEMFGFYRDIDEIIKDYFVFNRKIDAYSDIKKINRVFEEVNNEKSNAKVYEDGISLCLNGSLSTSVTGVSQMLPYVFHLLLEMTLIDHNFIASNKNLVTLMRLHVLLKNNDETNWLSNNYTFLDILSYLKNNTYIDRNVIEKLQSTLNLFQMKNNLLIFKMMGKIDNDEEKYAYVNSAGVTLLKPMRVDDDYYSLLTKKSLIPSTENFIYKKYISFLEKKCNDAEFEEKLEEYEKLFVEIICSSTDNYLPLFSKLNLLLDEKVTQISAKYRDINLYNEVILNNFKSHFEKYGKYIKKLKIHIKSKRNDPYLQKIADFVEENKDHEMLSCAFILKHLQWALDVLKEEFIEKSENSSEDGFRYLRLSEILLRQLKRLIKSIEADQYCINYSSFFQDCFFEVKEDDELVRYVVNHSDIKSSLMSDKNIVFISSTWQPPVSIDALKQRYEEFSDRIQILLADFYNNYFKDVNRRQIEELGKTKNDIELNLDNKKVESDNKIVEYNTNMIKQLSDNRRETVQILGIFAAFLALATIGLGNASSSSNVSSFDLMRHVCGICMSFGYFVILLQLVLYIKDRPKLSVLLFVIIAILTYYLGSFYFAGVKA